MRPTRCGVIGGPQALDSLARLLADAEPSVRYNAATGLARHGDSRAIPRLIEMLDVRSSDATSVDAMDEIAATTIIQNALRATVQLAQSNPNLDLGPVQEAIERLNADAQLSGTVRRGIELDLKAAQQSLEAPSTARQASSSTTIGLSVLTTCRHRIDAIDWTHSGEPAKFRL